MNRLPAIMCVAFVLSSCSQAGSDVSGVYVERSGNQILFIQIVKAEDGNITGRGELVSAENGSLNTQPFSLTGTADGSQISLKSNVFLGLGPSFSGEVKGNKLTLVGADGHSVLKRSSLEDFTKQKGELTNAAQADAVADQNLKASADQRKFLADLAQEGLNIETKMPPAYVVIDQKTDAFLADTRSRYDAINGNIRKLKAKLMVTPSDDKGYVEGDIQSAESDLSALESDYTVNLIDIRVAYDELEARFKRVQSAVRRGR